MTYHRSSLTHVTCMFLSMCKEICTYIRNLHRNLLQTKHGKGILYQMISRHSYQNLINERHMCKNNYPLTHVFYLLVGQLFFTDMSHTYWILILLMIRVILERYQSWTRQLYYIKDNDSALKPTIFCLSTRPP